MPTRDDFAKPTKTKLAQRAGYLCSRPECRRLTIGAAAGSDGAVIIGEAAHITAAAPGGPRYDPYLSFEERRSQTNGIWLCAVHAKQVDSDEKHFTVELLRDWKAKAEKEAFAALATGSASMPSFIIGLDTEALEDLGHKDVDIGTLSERLLQAAKQDLSGFKSTTRWPSHVIALTLRTADREAPPFDVWACVAGIQSSGELVIVSPSGTGKTTTSIQFVDAILINGEKTAVLVPLSEWAMQNGSFFESLTYRAAFRIFREEDFIFLALHGRLTLVLDGWNELGPANRLRAITEVTRLRRELPFLELVITTRRQQMDLPVSGPILEIEPMSENQQLEIARATYSAIGEEILDRAWHTPGLRELVSIPLYLDALLHEPPAGAMPRSQEEVLRLFVGQHERSPEKAEALRQGLHGLHDEFLTGLAVEATISGNTAIPEARARLVVAMTGARLKAAGQISQEPQPSDVIDLLVNHHTLVRTGGSGAIYFHHQQIQELYASNEVEALMKEAAAGNEDSRKRLREKILNIPIWEEPILFACERLSCAGESGITVVAACILETLGIDPILSADMIYRSTLAVWDEVKDKVVMFVSKWHKKGVVDRAVCFMITTGRSEFAPLIWPLVTHNDDQVNFAALRAADRFRPSVLGLGLESRLAAIPEHIREHVVTEIANNSGMDGMELAAKLAKCDPSAKVQVAVIEALLFRRSERLAREVLKTAPDEVWSKLALKGYADEITDRESVERLIHERALMIEKESDMLHRIRMLLEEKEKNPEIEKAIAEMVQSEAFPIKEQNARWALNSAFKRYPDAVSSALIRRLETGYELPWGSAEMLANSTTLDEGPIAGLVLYERQKNTAEDAVTLVGSKTIRILLNQFIATQIKFATSSGRLSREEANEYYRLRELIKRTRQVPFIESWLTYGDADDPARIAALSDLLARHKLDYDSEAVLHLEETARTRVEAVLRRWGEVLLSSPASNRHQFSELARAIGRLGSVSLTDPLGRLLAEDLVRWRRARETFRQARARGEKGDRSDSAMSYTPEYGRAFAAIGGEHVSAVMEGYLRDPDFGFEAACVLKSIHDSRSPAPAKDTSLVSGLDFSVASMRRAVRANGVKSSTPEAEIILAVVAELLVPGSEEAEHHRALGLAKIGLSLPHGDKTDLVDALLALPVPIRSKRDILMVLVLDGEIVPADLVLDGVKNSVEAAKKEYWRQENQWEVERWLTLLPFSNRPRSLLEAIDLSGQFACPIHHMHTLFKALQNAPGKEVESILADLARRDLKLLTEHTWLSALLARGTVTALLLLLDLLCEPALCKTDFRDNAWWIAETMKGILKSHPEFHNELLRRYEDTHMAACHSLIEQILAKSPDSRSVLAMVRRYATSGRKYDGLLSSAIEHIALEQRMVQDWQNAYELHSVDISKLRKQLFGMVVAGGPEMPVAMSCLTAVDQLRDEYGRPDSEPRHPDVEAGLAWPVVLD